MKLSINVPASKKTDNRWILGLTIFVMGGCGLAYEYTFSKIASDLMGNSVRQWAVVIAVMLFCMGMGAEIQRFIPQRKVVTALLMSQILLALLGGFGPMMTLGAFAHFPYYFALVHYCIISVIGILIGFEIPLITRLNENYTADIKTNLASVLKMDYIGALLGALIWVFILPKFFNLHQIAYILGGLSILTALLCWVFFKDQVKNAQLLFMALIFSGLALGYGFIQSKSWAIHAEQAVYMDKVIFSTTTPYQHIVLTESRSGTLRCYINGHIQFSSSDEHIYHEHLVHPAMTVAGRKERVLVLGGGDGMAIREVLLHPEVKEIVLVDLDPEMTRLSQEHPILSQLNSQSLTDVKVTLVSNSALEKGSAYPLEHIKQRRLRRTVEPVKGPNLHILNLDAANYIKQAEGRFDVIILDFPDPSSPELAKLYSIPFYGELKHKLALDGVMVQQSTSPHRAKEAFLCIGRTLQASGFSAVPTHDHVPSFGEWGWWVATHAEYYTEDELFHSLENLSGLPEGLRYLTPKLIEASLHFGQGNLSTKETNITTLSEPAVLEHYLHGWSH